MHIMGGFGVASLAVAIAEYFKKPISFWKLFAAYVVVAVAWELYEYVHDVVTYTDWNGWVDTSKDFINGAIGTLIAYILISKK